MEGYEYKTKPYRHQREANERANGRQSFAWFMEMGTGKTKVAIDEMSAMYEVGSIDAVVILAPKGSYMNWINNEFPAHMPDRVYDAANICEWRAGGGSKGHQSRLAGLIGYDRGLPVLVQNIEALSSGTHGYLFLSRFVAAYKKVAMYVDESTTIRTWDATRTTRAIEIGKKCLFRRIMTGYAAPRSPMDLFGQFAFLGTSLLGYNSFYSFRSRYAILKPEFFGGRRVQIIVGYRDVEELTRRIQPHSYRVTKEECLDLPPKVYSTWEVEMTAEQTRIYNEVKQNATSALEELGKCPDCIDGYESYYDTDGIKNEFVCNKCGGVGKIAGANVTAKAAIVQILRLHQILCGHVNDEEGISHDVPSNRVRELLTVLKEADSKTIIWARYRRDIEMIVEAIEEEFGKTSVVQYHGGVGDADRVRAIDQFQKGAVQFFVANAATGGFGITLTAAKTVVYYSNDYDLEKRMQSEDRAHRVGQTKSVNYVDLVVRNTVDEKILQALRAKIDIGSALMGDGYREWLI